MTAQLKIAASENQEEPKKKTGISEKIQSTFTDELILGICAPIGSLKEKVLEAVRKRAVLYGYEPKVIRLSKYISKHSKDESVEENRTKEFQVYFNKIKGGDQLRSKTKNNRVLIELAIKEIHLDRYPGRKKPESNKEFSFKSRRVCYIIDSLKRTEEYELLRDVYRDSFYSIGILSPYQERIDNLVHNKSVSIPEADILIETDLHEKDSAGKNHFGQNVRDTFVLSDFIVRASKYNLEHIEATIERYFHLIFNTKIVTPLPHEKAMYEAKSVAGNSSCLSRQVGASIMSEDGEILALGWNDVPKANGGLYQEQLLTTPNQKIVDFRCFLEGFCSNDRQKEAISEDIANWVFGELKKEGIKIDSVDKTKFQNRLWKSTQIKDLIEFSRAVHAEMHAIISGSQNVGKQIQGATLFCTTYPCHNCARHIIAAGIKKVIYIEPYAKSKSTDLHSDSITEDETDTDKVQIIVFDGVAPNRYLEFFTKLSDRKDSKGDLRSFEESEFKLATPRKRMSLEALPTLESQVFRTLEDQELIES